MEDRLFIIVMNLFVYIILLILQILTPKMTRKNIYFGIRIPEEELNNEELKKIYIIYVIENILISIPSIALLSYWTYNSNSPIVVTLTIFIYIVILFLVYLHGNNKMKKLKEEKEWKGFKDEVVVDLKFSKNRASAASISFWWFLIPVGIALINLIVGLNISSKLPKRIPTNWDFQGNITGYMDKNFFIWFMPLVQLGMTGTMFFVCKIIGWSKQEISAKNPEESVKRNIIFRRIWSVYILVTNIVLNILFTLASFYSFGILGGSVNTIIILFFIFTSLIILSSIIISIKVGQGGSRLKFDGHYEERNRDDDRFWKLGSTIYYNPEDPALFIEKRFGVGWTVNAGRPLGMFLMIIPFIIIVFTLLLVS